MENDSRVAEALIEDMNETVSDHSKLRLGRFQPPLQDRVVHLGTQHLYGLATSVCQERNVVFRSGTTVNKMS